MKTYRKTVFVSFEAAAKDFDEVALKAAVADNGLMRGPLNTQVRLVEKGYNIMGDARSVSPDDDMDEVNATLAKDLGEIGRVTEKEQFPDLFPAGQPIDLYYCLNHDGLPLAYNGAIRATFAKQSSKTNDSEKLAATIWASEQPDKATLFALMQAKGFGALVEEYRKRTS